ncbi:pancreatic triacylglycerol lipase-like [Choristoneura fumiferana]|uniref:pancreatic triacylglycerol lipase-like n=1 Tax=Choristoneura fumiferana TaxID=7141 RepID=UPI003D15A042
MAAQMIVLVFCVAAVAALPADTVISKLNDGPRYQYVSSGEGPKLVDTWLTSSSMARTARYAPDTENVYHLFTRQNPTISQPMLLGVPSLIAANFDPSRSTVVLIHGWSSSATSDFVVNLVPRILAAADVNVIAVDWSAGAYEPNYYSVVANNVPLSGSSIGSFIFWLNLSTGASIATYHVIGFETGAHIAGLVGRSLGGLIPHITALEPPRPGFNLNSNAFLSTDGIFTEAMHTNAGVTGLVQPVADVDFYPNGGTTMAGCRWWDWECSRDRAYQYLGESILTGGFTGVLCESLLEATSGSCESEETLNMGGLTAKFGSSGIYYLTTNEQSPFSTG